MKKYILTITMVIGMFHFSIAHALDGIGTVDEIMICTGTPENTPTIPGWTKMGLFRLSDGNWFGAYVDYAGDTTRSETFSDSSIYSTAMMAFTTRKQVSVRATYATRTVCGITATFLFNNPGDYIRVIN